MDYAARETASRLTKSSIWCQGPRAPGIAIEHPQFVRLFYTNVFTIENDVRFIGFGLRQIIFMKSYLALKERYLQTRSSKCQYGDTLPDSHLVISLTLAVG